MGVLAGGILLEDLDILAPEWSPMVVVSDQHVGLQSALAQERVACQFLAVDRFQAEERHGMMLEKR
eukprot:2849266-Rhodomonas_salina.1